MATCWAAFALVWLAGWAYGLLRAPKFQCRRFSPMILVGAVIAYAAPWLVPDAVWNALTVDHWALRAVGLALLVSGTVFALTARWALGAMWSGIPSRRIAHELCTTGPYAYSRHPIYAGVLAMLLGTTLAYGAGSYLAALIAGAVGLALKIRVEERLMLETFGERYEAYRRSVPALIPLPRAVRKTASFARVSKPAA